MPYQVTWKLLKNKALNENRPSQQMHSQSLAKDDIDEQARLSFV